MGALQGYVMLGSAKLLMASVAPYTIGAVLGWSTDRSRAPASLAPVILGIASLLLVSMLLAERLVPAHVLVIVMLYSLSAGILTATPSYGIEGRTLPKFLTLAGGLLDGLSGYMLSYYTIGSHPQVLSLTVTSLTLFSLGHLANSNSSLLKLTGALTSSLAVYASFFPGGIPWLAPVGVGVIQLVAVLATRTRGESGTLVAPIAGAALLVASAGPAAGVGGQVLGTLIYIGSASLLAASCYLACGESRALIPAILGAAGAMLVGRSLAGAYDPLLGASGLLAGVALGSIILSLPSRALGLDRRILAVAGLLLLLLAPTYYSVSEAVIVERHLPHAGIPVDTCGLQLQARNATASGGPLRVIPISGQGVDRLVSAVRSEEARVRALATALEGDEGGLVWLAARHNTTVHIVQVALVERVVVYDFAANTTIDLNLSTPTPLLVELEQPAILQAAVALENETPVFRVSVRVRGLVLPWNAIGGTPLSPVHSVVEMWFDMPMMVGSPDGRVALTIEKAVVSAVDIVGGRSTVEDTPLGQRIDPALIGVEQGHLIVTHPTRGTTEKHEVPAQVSNSTLEALRGLALIGEKEPQLQKLLQWEPTLARDLLQLAPGQPVEVATPSYVMLTVETSTVSLVYVASPGGGMSPEMLLPRGLDMCALRVRGDPEGGNLTAALLAWNASSAGATPLQVAVLVAWGGYERIPDTLRLVGMLEDGGLEGALRFDSVRLRLYVPALLLPFIAVLPLLTASASSLRSSLAARRALS